MAEPEDLLAPPKPHRTKGSRNKPPGESDKTLLERFRSTWQGEVSCEVVDTLMPVKKFLRMLQMVRSGVWPHVAAGACGVTRSTFYRWMRRGGNDVEPYKTFRFLVLEEHAAARANAESHVWRHRPFEWLKFGPGRDQGDPEDPGWTDDQKMRLVGADGVSSPKVTLEFTASGPKVKVLPSLGEVVDAEVVDEGQEGEGP